MSYQLPKTHDFGVNSCPSCLDKQRQIDLLKQEIQSLKDALRYRQRNRQDGPFGSSTPSSQLPNKPNTSPDNKIKKGGAKPGHKGHSRSSVSEQDADSVRHLGLGSCCPECGGQLQDKGTRCRTIIDLDRVEVKHILYRLDRKLCLRCGSYLQAQPEGVLPKAILGNQLIAEMVAGHYLQGIPIGRLCVNFQINIGTFINTVHRVANLFEPALDQLYRDLRLSKVRHADETRWRTDGQSGYCWLFCTSELSIYLFGKTRASTVVKEVLGSEPLGGRLVVDRYQGYNKAPCQLQYCYAHLMREVEDLAKEFAGHKEVELFTATLIPLLAKAQHLRGQPISDQQYYKQAQELKRQIEQVNLQPARHAGIRRVQDIFVDKAGRLYHWVEDRAVPAENNYAERELRPTVIARKVSYGSQSEEGANSRGIMMSVLQTLRKRVEQPKQRIKEVLDRIARGEKVEVYEMLFGEDSS
jgi:transposase